MKGVRQKFGQYFILTGKLSREWGRFYSILFNIRSAADYEDFKTFNLSETQEMYPKVCSFIELIDHLILTNKQNESEKSIEI